MAALLHTRERPGDAGHRWIAFWRPREPPMASPAAGQLRPQMRRPHSTDIYFASIEDAGLLCRLHPVQRGSDAGARRCTRAPTRPLPPLMKPPAISLCSKLIKDVGRSMGRRAMRSPSACCRSRAAAHRRRLHPCPARAPLLHPQQRGATARWWAASMRTWCSTCSVCRARERRLRRAAWRRTRVAR